MPIFPPIAATTAILPQLLATGMIGTGTPTYSLGLATGLAYWVPTISVTTIDSGTLGVGAGILPLPVLPPILYAALTATYVANGIYGPLAPLHILGLSNGISLTLAMGIITTIHPTVGVGVGVATFQAPPAMPFILKGFNDVGIKGDGPTKNANAIGQALNAVISALIVPVPIVGAPAPSPSAGVGTGSIL
jgi:hypothetical protein